MSEKKRALPGAGTPSRAAEPGRASREGRASNKYDIMSAQSGQVVHIADFLGRGHEAAVPLRHLAHLTGLNEREVRKRIEYERRAGVLIVSDNQCGYWLTDDPAEVQRFARSMRHRAQEILRTARAIERSVGLD